MLRGREGASATTSLPLRQLVVAVMLAVSSGTLPYVKQALVSTVSPLVYLAAYWRYALLLLAGVLLLRHGPRRCFRLVVGPGELTPRQHLSVAAIAVVSLASTMAFLQLLRSGNHVPVLLSVLHPLILVVSTLVGAAAFGTRVTPGQCAAIAVCIAGAGLLAAQKKSPEPPSRA